MRYRARRLWLGDWDREHDSIDPDDTVVITAEPEDAERSERRRSAQRGAAITAAVAVCALAFAVSYGDQENPLVSERIRPPAVVTPQFQTPQPQPQLPQAPQGQPGGGFGAPSISGTDAQRAAQAALRQFPGEIERVTAGPTGGGYVVHVLTENGEIHVAVDDQFKVQGSDEGRGPRSSGPPGNSQ